MKYTKLILDERMIVPEPKIRLEFFLHSIITGETCELKPKTVDEEYLYAIATSDTSRMGEIYPRTLVEMYYDAILNNSVEDLPIPRTRWEEFLRSAITKESCGLEPESSLEIYLSQISSNGGFDYIVSTSTNSTIISLPNSTNGIIKSIEMDGNTLVNYCTNGSEELTLNNEINTQGTDVTLTDTTDNGKVNVMCEGNTLVNCLAPLTSVSDFWSLKGEIDNGYVSIVADGTYKNYIVKKDKFVLKPSTIYTFVVDIKENTLVNEVDGRYFLFGDTSGSQITYWKHSYVVRNVKTGIMIFTLPTRDTFDDVEIGDRGFVSSGCTSGTLKFRYMVLEGDYTNKPIPSYFEGMKSVGELEDNKIEILSQNKNLFKDKLTNLEIASGGNDYSSDHASGAEFIRIKPNTSYTLSSPIPLYNSLAGLVIAYYDINKKFIKHVNMTENKISPSNARYCRVRTRKNPQSIISTEELSSILLQLEEGTVATSHVQGSMNKKEISLNKPLRGLPNGVCDKFVKQGGKWYIERNCGELKNINTILSTATGPNYGLQDGETLFLVSSDYFKNVATSNKLLFKGNAWTSATSFDQFYITLDNKLWLRLPVMSNSEAIEYLKDVIIIAELITPIYEPLEVEPTLNTYTDTTHISTNSTIPCNMVVKNSGYNAIIKPSTQYTVAFDTNTSGEVGINLGGAKVTTTNNVATITTPSTLTDDSLTLYGKGIKASKVRLLEGDKTNYIPSYFEGMKSCFEDKLQDDGSYKMEILSNNENLFDMKSYQELLKNDSNITITENGFQTSNGVAISKYDILARFKPNTQYKVSVKRKNIGGDTFNLRLNIFYTDGTRSNVYTTLTSEPNKTISKIGFAWGTQSNGHITQMEDIHISEYSENYIMHKSNKIQFSLIEPLRAVGNVKDRFVFKNGKLMIERKLGQKAFSGNEQWAMRSYSDGICRFYLRDSSLSLYPKMLSNKFYAYDILGLQGINEGVSGHNAVQEFRLYVKDIKLNSPDVEGLNKWLQENPTTVVYQLAEPTYEEVPTSQRLTCYEYTTLFIDTNITPTHVEIEYPIEKQQLFRIK